jgi:hypothetical protein
MIPAKLTCEMKNKIPPEVHALLKQLAEAIDNDVVDSLSGLEQAWDMGVLDGKVIGVQEAREILSR